MIRFSTLVAALSLLIVSFPSVTDGQINIFKRDRDAIIIRKARRYNLAAMKLVAPDVFIELRYKVTSAANRPLYGPDMPALIHHSTGKKLQKVSEQLRPYGYGLKLWDGWRPPEAHFALWNAVKDPKFVVPPSKGLSWHCYGISADVTLVRLDGSAVEMPSDFDDFTPNAASDYQGGDPEIAKRVALLQRLMINAGFRKIRSEWWHFDDMKAEGGIRNVTAADLGIRMP
ncbi:MAG: M15 family metallopeptidase [Verrucomicrobiota bacterium]